MNTILKTVAVAFLLSLAGIAFGEPQVVTNTGIYGIYVKSMPFWTFWNYPRAVRILADGKKENERYVRTSIKVGLPTSLTRDYQSALTLQKKLKNVHCDIEIREMRAVYDERAVHA
jgi:hypothetical protein